MVVACLAHLRPLTSATAYGTVKGADWQWGWSGMEEKTNES